MQKVLIGAALAAAVGTAIYQASEVSDLRSENQKLLNHQQQLAAERDDAFSTAARSADELEQLRREKTELLRLRGEIGVLRQQLNECAKLQEQHRQSQAALLKADQAPQQAPEEKEKAQWQQKVHDTKTLAYAMIQYADRHQGRFPTNFNQITPYFEQALKDALKPGDTLRDAAEAMQLTNRFDIAYQGGLQPNLGEVILLREKQAELRDGKWVKVYGFCDGSAQVLAEPEGGFETWEAQHIIATQGTIP